MKYDGLNGYSYINLLITLIVTVCVIAAMDRLCSIQNKAHILEFLIIIELIKFR